MDVDFPVREGARLSYEQLVPPQNKPEEEFRPEIHRASVNPQNVTVLTPPSIRKEEIPSVWLARADNPRQAYALLPRKKSIRLDHHGHGWGEVNFAMVLDYVSPGVFTARVDHMQYVAVKRLNKAAVQNYLSRGGEENPYKEIARMQELGDNIHVLACTEALECDENLYIITPRACQEGTLKDTIAWMTPDFTMDPVRVWKIFRKLLRILLYLEHHGICHHDVSPDNFLFLTPDNLVIFDLALSVRMPVNSNGQRTLITPQGNFGTRAYMDPAVFVDGLFEGAGVFDGVAYDLFATVLLLYNLSTSQILYRVPHPIDANFRFFILARALSSTPMNEMAVQAMTEIVRGNENPHEIHTLCMAHLSISPRVMEVLENVLKINPSERWTLAQVIESDYVQYGDD